MEYNQMAMMSLYRPKGISLLLALVSLSVSLFFWVQLSGADKGIFYGIFRDPPSNGFAADGPNYYQSLNSWYFLISSCLLVCLVTSWWNHASARVMSAAALCISAIAFWNMIAFKKEVIGIELCCEPYPWLVTSAYFDMFTMVVVFALLLIEVVTLFRQGSEIQSISDLFN